MSTTLLVIIVIAAAAYGVYSYMGKRSDAKKIQSMAQQGLESKKVKSWEDKGA